MQKVNKDENLSKNWELPANGEKNQVEVFPNELDGNKVQTIPANKTVTGSNLIKSEKTQEEGKQGIEEAKTNLNSVSPTPNAEKVAPKKAAPVNKANDFSKTFKSFL
jgi:hypothetical protein